MNRRFDIQILSSTLTLRGRTLRALLPNSDKAIAAGAGELRALVSELRTVASQTAGLPEARALRLMSEALRICFYLPTGLPDETGRGEGPPFPEGRKGSLGFSSRRPVQIFGLPPNPAGPCRLDQPGSRGLGRVGGQRPASASGEGPDARHLLDQHNPNGRAHRRLKPDEGGLEHPALSAPTDAARQTRLHRGRATLATPQVIASGRQYGLRVWAQGHHIPADQRALELDYVTTMATADYGITPFLLEMPGNDRRASVEGSGHLIIRAASPGSAHPPPSK